MPYLIRIMFNYEEIPESDIRRACESFKLFRIQIKQ